MRAGGTVFMRTVRIQQWNSNEFRKLWATNKRTFLERGFSMSEDNGAWHLEQWLAGNPGAHTLTPVGMDRLARALEPQRKLSFPDAPQTATLDLPPLPNGIEDKLYEYQRQSARQLYRAVMNGRAEWGYPGAWECSDMGTGKTYSTLAAALASGLEIGVICPKAVIGTFPKYGGKGSGWNGAFAHFGAKPLFVLNYESLRTGGKEWIKKTGNPGRPYEWTCDPEHTILIWDEAHRVANRSSNRSMALAAERQGFPCLFASGTMAENPTNLGATGVAVGLHGGDRASYEQFLVRHGCVKTGDSWYFPKGYAAPRHLAAIHRAVFPRRGARVSIAELGDRFPATEILCEAVETDATKEISEAWKEVEAMLKRQEEAGESKEKIKAISQVAWMHAWRASEVAKIPAIVAMARAELEQDRSVAIFVNFSEARERLMAEFKTRCGIYGDQRDRDQQIAAFQADDERVIVCNIKAGGVGVSLHDVNGDFPRTAIILPTNSAVEMGQALGRVHRAGGKSKSKQIVMFAAKTLEEKICEVVRGKLANMATLNDGDLCPPDKF